MLISYLVELSQGTVQVSYPFIQEISYSNLSSFICLPYHQRRYHDGLSINQHQ